MTSITFIPLSSFLASGSFCCLLITFANSLDPGSNLFDTLVELFVCLVLNDASTLVGH